MQPEIIKEFGQFGIFAALFVWLLFYVLKENSKREEKYQDCIKTLSETLKSELCEIKEELKKRGLHI